MYKVKCIKCTEVYESEEQDPYYCSPCNVERLAIAKEVDKKIATMPPKRPVVSELQQFDDIAKQRGGGCHVNIADLGITL